MVSTDQKKLPKEEEIQETRTSSDLFTPENEDEREALIDDIHCAVCKSISDLQNFTRASGTIQAYLRRNPE